MWINDASPEVLFIIINSMGTIQELGYSQLFNICVNSNIVISFNQFINVCKTILISSKLEPKLKIPQIC